MVYGYLRVSKIEQDNEKFRLAILEYCNKNSLQNIEFVEEKVTGVKHWKQRELGILLNKLHEGDVLIIPELSRLARSISQIYEIITYIQSKGIEAHILKQNLIIKKDLDVTTKIMLSTFSMISEIERDFISMRTKEALASKKANGFKLGRKVGSGLKLEGKEDDIKRYLSLHMNITNIARLLQVNRATLYSFIKRNKLKGESKTSNKTKV